MSDKDSKVPTHHVYKGGLLLEPSTRKLHLALPLSWPNLEPSTLKLVLDAFG